MGGVETLGEHKSPPASSPRVAHSKRLQSSLPQTGSQPGASRALSRQPAATRASCRGRAREREGREREKKICADARAQAAPPSRWLLLLQRFERVIGTRMLRVKFLQWGAGSSMPVAVGDASSRSSNTLLSRADGPGS